MNSTVRGHCLCGHVTYEYTGTIGPAGYCHCTDCRRITGSAFNIGVRLEIADFHLTGAAPASFTKRADSGNEITRHFCPKCGSPVYTSSPVHPEFIYVKAGSFDDPGIVRPAQENWTISSVSWSRIPDGLPRYRRGTGSDAA